MALRAKWRPFVKQLYLRVHPDFFSGTLRPKGLENEKAMKELDSLFDQMPNKRVHLKFNLLCSEKKRIENTIETTVKPCNNRKEWEKSITDMMHTLLYGVVEVQELPKKNDASNFFGEKINAQEEEKEKQAKMKKKLDEEKYAPPLSNVGRPEVEQMLRTDYLWFSSPWDAMELDIDKFSRSLFKSNRIRSAVDVDPYVAVELIFDSFKETNPEALVKLSAPMFKDLVLVVSDERPTELVGSVIYINSSLKPLQVAMKLEEIVKGLEKQYLKCLQYLLYRELEEPYRLLMKVHAAGRSY